MLPRTSLAWPHVPENPPDFDRQMLMPGTLEQLVTPFLGVGAVAYAVLAVHVARQTDRQANNMVCFSLLLVAGMLAGSSFSFAASDPNIYGIGRVLTFFSTGFLPIVFYILYREFTAGPPSSLLILALAIIPMATTALALTNSMHHYIWVVTDTAAGLRFSDVTDHYWFNRVYAPFTYGLFGYSTLALLGRLPTIAPAHRKTIALLLSCALVPLLVSIANTLFGIGPRDFPFTSTTLALLLPLIAYVSLTLRVHEFSPLAYQTLFDHVRDPIVVIDNDQCIICANKAAQELLKGDEHELIGHKLWQDFPAARAILDQAKGQDLTQTWKMDTNSIYEVHVGPLTGKRGQNLGMVVVCRDVTERRMALSRLADSEHLIRTLIETSSNGILRFARDENDPDRKFRCVFANRAAESFAGGGRGTLVGMPVDKLDYLNPKKLLQHFDAENKAVSQISFEVAAESVQEGAWLRIVGEPVGDDFSVTLVDITQRKRNEDKMLADALRDPLTGVLNRRGFEREGSGCVSKSSIGAVLYLDLNQFKSINDRFGHPAGDALLKAFGHRLEFCLRPDDVLGRLGGDEFGIVLPGVGVDVVKQIAERLVLTASEAYIIQGQEIKCTASVGIALMPKHGNELWHLLSIADQAMYGAKSISAEEAENDCAAYIEAATAS
jgi:diguanylate cyclase (GGDEF)-like protein/PAS domain S-box-containing protein